MAEGFINFTEGSGKKLRTYNRTIGANSTEEQYVNQGDYPIASYTVVWDVGGIANDHIIQIMAGASLNVRIKSIDIRQAGNLTTAAQLKFSIFRLTTAGTGGTAVTPQKLDNGDAAAGATAMTLPTVKGTEGGELVKFAFVGRQAILTTAAQATDGWHWEAKPGAKPIIIAAGTANGIAIKTLVTLAGGGTSGTIELVETAYL